MYVYACVYIYIYIYVYMYLRGLKSVNRTYFGLFGARAEMGFCPCLQHVTALVTITLLRALDTAVIRIIRSL